MKSLTDKLLYSLGQDFLKSITLILRFTESTLSIWEWLWIPACVLHVSSAKIHYTGIARKLLGYKMRNRAEDALQTTLVLHFYPINECWVLAVVQDAVGRVFLCWLLILVSRSWPEFPRKMWSTAYRSFLTSGWRAAWSLFLLPWEHRWWSLLPSNFSATHGTLRKWGVSFLLKTEKMLSIIASYYEGSIQS